MRISTILQDQASLKNFKKEDFDNIDKKLKENLPALFGKNLLNFDKHDQLFFSSNKNLNDMTNIEEIIRMNYFEYGVEDPEIICHNLINSNSGKKSNIFFLDFDRDGNPAVLYKIEEKNKQDKFYFNTSLYKTNIFEGPNQVRKALNVKKKTKIHEFEIKDETLTFFTINKKLCEKIENNKENFFSILEEKNNLKKIKVRNSIYSIYTFWDFNLGEQDAQGFDHYGILIEANDN